MPPRMPKALERSATLAIDLANTQVMAALNTSSHSPGARPLAVPPAKNCGAETRLGLNSHTITQ